MLKHDPPGRQKNSGFTLVELLVAISVFSVLIAVAAPSFQSFTRDARQVTLYNKVANVMRLARSEAIKRSISVSVCPRQTDSSCGNDWSKGMLVYDDALANGAAGTLDVSDTVLRVVKIKNTGVTLTASAIVRPLTTTASQFNIRFSGRGQTNWSSGTWLICDGRGDQYAKALVMTGAGIGRRAYTTSSSNGVVVDGQGVAVSC